MCEFAVYDIDDPSKRIAEDIVRATIKNGNLTIRKVLGESMALENTVILEVDVSKEQMIVSHFPPLGKMTRLAGLISEYGKNPSSRLQEEIQALWKQAKAEGDLTVGTLKRKT